MQFENISYRNIWAFSLTYFANTKAVYDYF